MSDPDRARRSALEAELLAEFDRRHPPRTRTRRARLAPLLAAAALAAGILAAAGAPAEYAAELGQRIEVRAPPGGQLPRGDALAGLIEAGLASAGGAHKEAEVRVLVKEGEEVVRVDVWGAPIEGIAERLRPALASAPVQVTTLSGPVRTSVLGLFAHRFLKLRGDPQALEAARRELQAALAAEGRAGTVEVDTPGGGKRVRVRVKQR
jgi:hypothetical protein